MTDQYEWRTNPPDGRNSTLGPTPIRGAVATLIRDALAKEKPRTPERAALIVTNLLVQKGILPNEEKLYKEKNQILGRAFAGDIKDLARRSGILFEQLPKLHDWVKYLDRDELMDFAHDLAKVDNADDVAVVTAQWKSTADINADPVLHGILSTPIA